MTGSEGLLRAATGTGRACRGLIEGLLRVATGTGRALLLVLVLQVPSGVWKGSNTRQIRVKDSDLLLKLHEPALQPSLLLQALRGSSCCVRVWKPQAPSSDK